MLTQSNSSKKKKLSTSEINKNDLKVNRGVELILNKPKPNKGGIKLTTEVILIIALPVSFLLFSIGVVSGWLIRDYLMNYQEIPRPHPEMFDENGNLVPDEIVAFRFENYDRNEEDDDS